MGVARCNKKTSNRPPRLPHPPHPSHSPASQCNIDRLMAGIGLVGGWGGMVSSIRLPDSGMRAGPVGQIPIVPVIIRRKVRGICQTMTSASASTKSDSRLLEGLSEDRLGWTRRVVRAKGRCRARRECGGRTCPRHLLAHLWSRWPEQPTG